MKRFLGYALLLVPVAFLNAQVHAPTELPVDLSYGGIGSYASGASMSAPITKNVKFHSPEAIAQVIAEFENKTLVEPYDLANKWRILHADMLEQQAQDYEQMAPHTSAPQSYHLLARQTWQLSQEMLRPTLKLTKDVKKSLKNTRNWMALRARQQELMSQQYAVMAKQTTNKQVIDILNQMSAKCQTIAESVRKALNIGQPPDLVPGFQYQATGDGSSDW